MGLISDCFWDSFDCDGKFGNVFAAYFLEDSVLLDCFTENAYRTISLMEKTAYRTISLMEKKVVVQYR